MCLLRLFVYYTNHIIILYTCSYYLLVIKLTIPLYMYCTILNSLIVCIYLLLLLYIGPVPRLHPPGPGPGDARSPRIPDQIDLRQQTCQVKYYILYDSIVSISIYFSYVSLIYTYFYALSYYICIYYLYSLQITHLNTYLTHIHTLYYIPT